MYMISQRQLTVSDQKLYGENSDWNYRGVDTQYSTHGLHTYLAAMIPQISNRLIKMYANKDSKILDPFVGGGSVTTEAYLSNISATGIDVNNLALIISKAKSQPISASTLKFISNEFDTAYNEVKIELPTFSERSNIDYWFKEYMFEPLSRISGAIDLITDQISVEERNNTLLFLQCVYSNTIRSVSLTYRNEIRLRRLQEHDFVNFNPKVYVEFLKRLEDSIERVGSLPQHDTSINIINGDAKCLPLPDKSHDLIITSPPYGDLRNTIPYDQFSKNMLYWLGYQDDDISRIRKHSLGSRGIHKDAPVSRTLDAAMQDMTRESAIRDTRYFYSDYFAALQEMVRVTSDRIIIVIGHRILNGVFVDNAQITTELLSMLGWSLEERFERKIPGKRLNRKMAFGNNSKGATIDKESILVYTPQ